jgi:hypothetical protein
MAYTLTYSLGTITVADTTINSQTSLNLPGRNYAGYGSPVDQNQLSILENFASYPTVGPSNPIPGQTWYNTASGDLNINTSANSTPNWTSIVVNNGNVNIDAGNVSVAGTLTTTDITTGGALLPGTMTGAWSLTSGSTFNMGSAPLTTTNITTGANTTAGSMTGTWTQTAGSSFYSPTLSANVFTANSFTTSTVTATTLTTGAPSTAGTLIGAWTLGPGSSFNFGAANLTTTVITTGAAATPGTMTGTWTLTPGSSLNATYADYAERFEADGEYDAGTVMEMGGEKEITAALGELSEEILGVVSTTAGMTMNSAAGTQKTHPAIAMAGRVPVKVRGVVRKGNRLVSAGDGFARAAKSGEATSFNTIGRSLEDKLTESEGKVLAAVSAKL